MEITKENAAVAEEMLIESTRSGNFNDAKQICNDLLLAEPDNVTAYFYFGYLSARCRAAHTADTYALLYERFKKALDMLEQKDMPMDIRSNRYFDFLSKLIGILSHSNTDQDKMYVYSLWQVVEPIFNRIWDKHLLNPRFPLTEERINKLKEKILQSFKYTIGDKLIRNGFPVWQFLPEEEKEKTLLSITKSHYNYLIKRRHFLYATGVYSADKMREGFRKCKNFKAEYKKRDAEIKEEKEALEKELATSSFFKKPSIKKALKAVEEKRALLEEDFYINASSYSGDMKHHQLPMYDDINHAILPKDFANSIVVHHRYLEIREEAREEYKSWVLNDTPCWLDEL